MEYERQLDNILSQKERYHLDFFMEYLARNFKTEHDAIQRIDRHRFSVFFFDDCFSGWEWELEFKMQSFEVHAWLLYLCTCACAKRARACVSGVCVCV